MTATVETAIATIGSYKGLDSRKTDAFELLSIVVCALAGKSPATGFTPMSFLGESGLGVEEETGVEVWTQSFETSFELVTTPA
jgi:hypothetical protein